MINIFIDNIVPIFLVLLFGIRLLEKKTFQNAEIRYFWLTLISCFLLTLEDGLETITALDPALRFWRILLSVLGYTLRSTAALGLLLVLIQQKHRHVFLWFPAVITFLINCTAFFCDIAFGFDENYSFYRGPLGIISFVVPLFYILIILIISIRRFRNKRGTEKFIIPVCILFCVATTVKGTLFGGTDLTVAIVVSSIFFYIVLYSHDNRIDTLTGLLNRQAYYDDCDSLEKNIKAVASLDMNGLKTLNDSLGHEAGDKALHLIGKCLCDVMDRRMSAYRIGGDEFIILFFHNDENKIAAIEKKIKEKVAACGNSISSGYAICCDERNLKETIAESDRLMYEDKSKYYKEIEHNKKELD